MPAIFTIIVATDINNGIGISNTLPWYLPEDLAHFKHITSGHPIIMGRKTFESIGRPLPNRRNIVITRNPDWQHNGVETVTSIAAAAALINVIENPTKDENQAFIIGGAEIYAASQALCTRMIVTEIDKSFDCDAFFPTHDPQQWQEISRTTYQSTANHFSYAFVVYQKQPLPPN
ncbi:MAG: dihydrofolate reductase [Glaciimonas sp.]|nr:dihydrofolate reductase [Glaciimonas sp.]